MINLDKQNTVLFRVNLSRDQLERVLIDAIESKHPEEGVSFLIDKIQRIESASAAKDEALKGWIKLHDDMIALGGDVKALSNEQIANFAVEQARLIRLTLASLSEGSR